LVFFNTESKFRGKVNHVGIYIGNNKFIHASSAKKKVVITSFTERPFYKRRFLRGERIVNSSSAYASSL
jgi:cell wall-associated NlpC family hydrolase